MELKYNNADLIKEEKTEKRNSKDELSRFEKFMEKGKELMKKSTTWLLIGATVVFTLRCGSSSTPEEDADAAEQAEVQEDTDAMEDVRDMIEEEAEEDVLSDESEEDAEDETIDVIEEDINEEDVAEEDAVEDDIIEEDAEEEELPPLECPEAVEHTLPTLNPDFETNDPDSISTSETGVNANYDFHISMNPDVDTTECPATDGRYAFVCVDEDTVNIEGQYYITATNTGTTLEPASSERNVCSPDDEYPAVAYEGNTPESLWNVIYDFGEETVDSIAGISLAEPNGFYFDVNGARNEVMDLSFTASSLGTYPISFKRDAAAITFNTRSFDGRGNEATNNYDTDANDVRSATLYLVPVNSESYVSYDLSVEDEYNLGKLCIRCDGGPYNVVKEIPLPVGFAVENACGQLGKPINIRFDVTYVYNNLPEWVSDSLTATASMSTDIVTGPDDNPRIVAEYNYTPPSDVAGASVWIAGNVVVECMEHVCSDGSPFSVSYETVIRAYDPDDGYYVGPDGPDLPSTCTCNFGG